MGAFPSNLAYVRQARRLRAALRHEPAKLHRALRDLSDSVTTPSIQPATPAERLAMMAASQMQGDILSYSARMDLLKEADRLSIGRFEANLIIAAVQHRASPRLIRPFPTRQMRIPSTAIIIALTEGLILWAAWAILH